MHTSTTSPAQLREDTSPATLTHPFDYVRRRRFSVDAGERLAKS